MNSTSYDYKTEQRGVFNKQLRDRAKVKQDSDLIACMGSKKAVAAYAQSNNLSETLVMAVWSGSVVL